MATEKEIKNQQELNKLVESLNGITQETLELQRSISNALQDSVSSLQFERTEKAQIRSITKEINRIASDNLTIIKDEFGTSKNIADIQKQINTLTERENILKSIKLQLEKDSAGENEVLLSGIEAQLESLQKITAQLEESRKESEAIRKNFGAGLFTGISEVIGDIPGLRKLKGPFEEAAKAARSTALSNKEALKTGGKQASVLGAGFRALGKSLLKALGPLALLKEAIDVFLQLDKGASDIARGIGVSYNTSLKLQDSFRKTALQTNNIFVTTQNLGKSFLAINKSLGTNAELSGELLTFQTKLVEQAGYSVEAATQISKLSTATGESSEDITKEFLGQVKLLNIQNDTAISERALLEDIQNISKGTLATFAGQVGELASASFEARKLGVSLQQLEGIADGLLDIESSLTAEFEAEVMIGKQLNLERARFAALTNDIATLGKELQNQDITRAKFANMNRLQQESIAKAIGLSRDELGNALIEQEAIANLSQFEGDSAKERFKNAVKELGVAGARAQLQNDTLADQLESASVQERFTQSIEKLKEVFVALINPLMPILDVFMSIANVVGVIVRALDPILKIATAPNKLIGDLFGGKSFSESIKGIGEGISDSMNTNIFTGEPLNVEDGIAPSSKGPFTITDGFGATTITARGDGLAVSPNIVREDRNTSGTVVLSDSQIQKIADAVRVGASNASINLDGSKVSSRLQTPMILNTLPGV